MRKTHSDPVVWFPTQLPPGFVASFRRWNIVITSILLFMVLGLALAGIVAGLEGRTTTAKKAPVSTSRIPLLLVSRIQARSWGCSEWRDHPSPKGYRPEGPSICSQAASHLLTLFFANQGNRIGGTLAVIQIRPCLDDVILRREGHHQLDHVQVIGCVHAIYTLDSEIVFPRGRRESAGFQNRLVP